MKVEMRTLNLFERIKRFLFGVLKPLFMVQIIENLMC